MTVTERTARTIVATTERLLLTQPRQGDAEAVFAVHGDPETNRYNPNGPHRDLAQSQEMLDGFVADWERDGVGYCTVATREEPDTVIGFAGLYLHTLDGEQVFNLYYRFRPSAWGRGYAAEAARGAMAEALPRFPGVPVVALIHADNLPSRRLAERLGLVADPDGRVDQEDRLIHRAA
ncbi:ribosomal-protein-alanine N-acetyltransferase [Kitasatospora sp. MAA19]|uniref:GNAT family N-acetyltransferase n=1 Tax=unclassified Kitasatospora TaxID=2633591 RepID=UPI002474AB63|nr:GNAT family N-acetyltransferase [Kitasatospora sp. MAA19]MDH6703961.1 ribosomal-protein-alanine N-acetyltransferase [Kitasatospora sp. MAA19]